MGPKVHSRSEHMPFPVTFEKVSVSWSPIHLRCTTLILNQASLSLNNWSLVLFRSPLHQLYYFYPSHFRLIKMWDWINFPRFLFH